MTKFVALLFVSGACLAFAQDTPTTSAEQTAPLENAHDNMLTSLAGTFFQGDFFNVYAFFNGVYDSTNQTLQSNRGGGAGYSMGGGVTGSKRFSNGSLSLNYRGDYRNYSSGFEGSGTNQYLSLAYTRRLGNRWVVSLNESAGILFYNNPFYTSLAPAGGGIQTNPFSPTTRFVQSSIYMSYRQTRRLSYTLGGSFFLSRYNYPGSIGTTGGIFSASAAYILTSRTTVGGTYSHDNFYFQKGFGNTNIDGGYADVTHVFGRAWSVSVSAGVTRAHTQGVINLPVQFILGGLPLTGYVKEAYNTVSYVPTVQGSVTHYVGKFSLSASAGRGVNPGNGTYLTSAHTYFGGSVSRKVGRQAILSGNTYYSHITSIANQVAEAYTQNYTTIAYSRVLFPHLSAYASYSYDRYGSLLGSGSSIDNRFIAGISFSSKSVPFTLF